jgi:gentisate 1,2-dioxygenase
MPRIIDPWPTVVAVYNYSDDLSKIKKIITESNEKFPHSDYNTTRHGHQPKYTVWPHQWQYPAWSPVYNFITSSIQDYVDKVFNLKYPVRVRNSWTVTYHDGGYQEPHAHPHNDISCLFVVEPSSAGGEFVLVNPNSASSFTLFHPWAQVIDLKAGDLLVWPSWMTHYTKPTEGPDKKMIISMDSMLVPSEEDLEKEAEKFYYE